MRHARVEPANLLRGQDQPLPYSSPWGATKVAVDSYAPA